MVESRRDEPMATADGAGVAASDFADAVWMAAVLGRARTGTAPSTKTDAAGGDLPAGGTSPGTRTGPPSAPPGGPPDGGSPPAERPGAGSSRSAAAAEPALRSGAAPSALPAGRDLGRALRPFKRRVLSAVEQRPDEEATAERAAEDGLWLPQTQPALTRWLALALVIDGSRSMAAWRPTVAAFRELVERHGSFRRVREFLLSPDGTGENPVITGPGTGRRDPAELLDPTGRQIVIVLTDGIDKVWRHRGAEALLRRWGRGGPLVIVNPYPHGYWHRTCLAPRRVQLFAPRPLVPNSLLRIRQPDQWRDPFDDTPVAGGFAVPVIELSPRWVGWWARLVTEPPRRWVDAMAFLPGVDPRRKSAPRPPATVESSKDLVLRFRSGASPLAFRLATYLAAAPLDLPLLREIQRTMLPQSRPHHLAEVIASELVHRAGVDAPLEFATGVREVLLACATREDSAQVLRAVADHYRERTPAARLMTRAIESPDSVPDPQLTAEALPMARIELAVLQALSGPYAPRAERLARSIAAVESGTGIGAGPSDSEPYPTRGGATMPDQPDATGFDQFAARVVRPGTPPDPYPTPIGGSHLTEDEPALSLDILLGGPDPEIGPAVWGNVPPRNPFFTGRTELLDHLHHRLQAESVAAVLPQALHGMGGVGKSQIAIEYAYRNRGEYEVVWWVPSEQPAQILASLVDLGERLGHEPGLEASVAVPRVQAALRAGTPYANWLLVFDNAETLDTVRPYFPEAGTGKVLVTSRNPEWGRLAQTLEVDVFMRDESVRLLRLRNPGMATADADRLAEALGDLPLAVEHASAWCATTGMAVSEYLSLLAEKRRELETLVPAPGYEMPVAAAWNVALDRLREENLSALRLLQVCSFFAPEPISRELFTSPRTTPIDPELDEALQNPSKLGQAFRDIQRYGLARIDHRHNTIQLHRLVKAVLVGRMPEERRRTMEHGAHVLLAGGNPGTPDDRMQWTRYQALAPHVMASDAVGCEDSWARELVLDIVKFYFHWGDPASCRDLAQQVFERWQAALGPNHPQTLLAAKWLGYVQWLLGAFAQAALINRDCLDRYRRTVGPDDEGTLDAMMLVAGDLRVAGEFDKARELNLDAFRRARRTLGEDEPATLRLAHDLGVSLRLAGDFRAARHLDTDTYRRRMTVLGDDHLQTLFTLNGLTLDHRECGAYLEAHALQERLYERHCNLYGVNHPNSVLAARNLAVARRRAGDRENARKLAEDTMNRFRQRFGEANRETIAAALNLAVDLREAGELTRARALAAQTAEQYHDVLGGSHPYTLYARTNLAIVLRLLGQAEEARRHNAEVWDTLHNRLGANHVLTLTCATNLASDLSMLGNHQAAYGLGDETVTRSRQVLGPDHPSTLAAALNLALDLWALGREDDAAQLHEQTVAAYRRVLDTNHSAVIAAAERIRANCDVDPMPM